MPKIIELTLEIKIDKVSCPGVWLCQYGNVSLTMFALGTGYQTCFLPPVFPLLFKDVFYFQKKFQSTCGLNNIACMLKDESIYCELIQWTDDSKTNDCFILAQYLGTVTDVLFPPNVCSLDGVDLLMRRTDIFPGILAPKIEISTKVRIDEVWDKVGRNVPTKPIPKSGTCKCKPKEHDKPGLVCHSPSYHKSNQDDLSAFQRDQCKNKLILESNFIEQDTALDDVLTDEIKERAWRKARACECAICKRYHELFHSDSSTL